VLAALVSLNSNVSQTDQAEGKHSVLAASARDLPIGPGMTRTFLTEAKLPQVFVRLPTNQLVNHTAALVRVFSPINTLTGQRVLFRY